MDGLMSLAINGDIRTVVLTLVIYRSLGVLVGNLGSSPLTEMVWCHQAFCVLRVNSHLELTISPLPGRLTATLTHSFLIFTSALSHLS